MEGGNLSALIDGWNLTDGGGRVDVDGGSLSTLIEGWNLTDGGGGLMWQVGTYLL